MTLWRNIWEQEFKHSKLRPIGVDQKPETCTSEQDIIQCWKAHKDIWLFHVLGQVMSILGPMFVVLSSPTWASQYTTYVLSLPLVRAACLLRFQDCWHCALPLWLGHSSRNRYLPRKRQMESTGLLYEDTSIQLLLNLQQLPQTH